VKISLRPRLIAVICLVIMAGMSVMHVLAGLFVLITKARPIPWYATLFYFDHEENLPTFYSSATLTVCAVLLGFIGVAGKDRVSRLRWYGLSAVFVFLAVDEFVSIHEQLIPIVRGSLNTTGAFYLAWVIPYGIAVVVLGLLYLKFLLQLPPRTRNLFFVAAFLFVLGAIGFEIIGGYRYQTYDTRDWLYQLSILCEELLEMTGVVVFLYALTTHIESQLGGLEIRFPAGRDPRA